MTTPMPPAVSSCAEPACGCGSRLDRRRLFALFGGLAAMGLTGTARAAGGDYDAMLVNCMDPRLLEASMRYMSSVKLRGKFSQFVIAGGPIGAIHPRFATWHPAFWDNLEITLQLHQIERVVAISHRDCGAAALAFGVDALTTTEQETEAHNRAHEAFIAALALRHPKVRITCAIMDLNGDTTIPRRT